MKYYSRLLFLIFILFLFSFGLMALIPQKTSNQSNKISNQNISSDNEPFLFYAMGPNGQIPQEMASRTPPELHPSPTGNSILFVDDFDTYKTEAEFIASPWDFLEPTNTYCNLKENKTLASSGKRCVEIFDNTPSNYAEMSRTFPVATQYLYVKINLSANQATGRLYVLVYGSYGDFYIMMGQNSNQWAIGSNGGNTNTGATYQTKKWYQVELFANILKNTYDFYVNNTCLASNVSFYSSGTTDLYGIEIFTGTADISDPNYYYIDSLEVAIPPKILCILAEFSDMAHSNSVNTMYQKIFTNSGSFRNYYKENSYNKFTVAGTVTPWIMMPQTMVYYGKDNPPNHDTYYGSRDRLPNDAIPTANSIVDFSIYDHIIVIHAGNDQAASAVADDIWSACFAPSSSYSYGPVDGVYIDHVCWVSELEGIGAVCHEFGHMLDLPDLYNYNPPPDHFVGDWCLMDSGSWNGPSAGSSPAHMMAWCKIKLGWLSTQNIEIISASDYVNGVYLYPIERQTTKEQVIKIEIDANHYYLVENRLKTGFDNYLPDQGIIVSYIDETLISGAGIVKVQNSHPGSTDFNVAAWDLSGSSEWQVFRDITRKIYVTVGTKSGNVYLMYVDRFPSGNRTYNTYTIPANNVIYWNISATAGRILLWDWFTSGSVDFRILRPSDAQEWEFISGVDHDGGVFRVPTTDLYQFRVRNTDLFSSRTIRIYLTLYYSPQLGIYDFNSLNSPIYRTNQFTLRLQVRNTAASLVEGITATINLPSGLNLVDDCERMVNIEDLGYYEYATVYWEVYAGSTGSKSIQVVMASIWGGAPTQNLTIDVILDTIPPNLYFISPTPANNSVKIFNDISIAWDVYDLETDIKTTSLFLNTSFITNTTGTSYDFLNLPDGLYYCKLISYDLENNAAQKLIIFRVDTKKPALAKIATPIALRWYANQIQIEANAYDNGSGIASVRFYNGNPASGGILLGTDSNGADGWKYNWITSSSDNGIKTLFIRVYDYAGWYNDSSGITIYIDNSPPTNINCLTLQNNGNYKGKITIQVTASDPLSGIRNVEFWIDSNLFFNDTSGLDGWNCTWTTIGADDGSHVIDIELYDNCGNGAPLLILITVDNSPPINLNCPTLQNGGTYSGDINIQLTGNDPATGINYVEFWLGIPDTGGILLYNDTISSNGWNYIWSTTQENNGNQIIFIRAYDGCGNSNSLTFSITVKNINYLLYIIIGIAAGAGVASIFIIRYVKKPKTALTQKLPKDLKKGSLTPPSTTPTPSPKTASTIKSAEIRPSPTQQPAPTPKPVVTTPPSPPLPPAPFQRPVSRPRAVVATPPSPTPPPTSLQRPAPSLRPAAATPPSPPPPSKTKSVPLVPRPSPLIKQVPPSHPPMAPIVETHITPADKLPIYRCPKCDAPIPAGTIENLKNGQIDLCSSCKTHLSGELIFSVPKKRSAAELLQDDGDWRRIDKRTWHYYPYYGNR